MLSASLLQALLLAAADRADPSADSDHGFSERIVNQAMRGAGSVGAKVAGHKFQRYHAVFFEQVRMTLS